MVSQGGCRWCLLPNGFSRHLEDVLETCLDSLDVGCQWRITCQRGDYCADKVLDPLERGTRTQRSQEKQRLGCYQQFNGQDGGKVVGHRP